MLRTVEKKGYRVTGEQPIPEYTIRYAYYKYT
jgi:hypothetical protein